MLTDPNRRFGKGAEGEPQSKRVAPPGRSDVSNSQPTIVAPRGPNSGVHPAVSANKPLLASEVLREELAPLEPSRTKCRVWLVGVSVALAMLGVALRFGVGHPIVGPDGSTLSFSAAGAALTVALLPFPYALRAIMALLLGTVLMVLGLRGSGPLAAIGNDGPRLADVLRLAPLTVLPAALLFRGRYRAYTRARWLLAAGLALTLPFIAREIVTLANAGSDVFARVAAATSVATVLCGLFGFMGAGTTGAGAVWAALVLAIIPGEIAVRELSVPSPTFAYASAAVGLACAAILATVGLYQLFAAIFASDARRIAASSRPDQPRESRA